MKMVRNESSNPSFGQIVNDLKQNRPSLIVYTSGEVHVLVGAIDDGVKEYLIEANPEQVAYHVRNVNVNPKDLESKDSGVRSMAESLASLKITDDYRLGRSDTRPPGLCISTYDPGLYSRWIAGLQWKPDFDALPGLDARLKNVANTVKEAANAH